MSRVHVRLRACAVGTAVTATTAILLQVALAELAPAARLLASGGAWPALDASFPLLLTWLAALSLAIAATWGCAVTLVVVVPLALRPTREPGRVVAGVPRACQRLLLAACGAALATGLALPAQADPGTTGGATGLGPRSGATDLSALSGLPLPTRATAVDPRAAAPSAPSAPSAPRTHVVRPGESLWSIAAAQLPPGASDADVTAAWQAVHRANRALVGADPDLIHPAQQLRLPSL